MADTNRRAVNTSGTPSPSIVTWASIENSFTGNGTGTHAIDAALLLGNGFSMNIWPSFGYRSLLEESNLQDPARGIFGDRCNFETVLDELSAARHVVGIVAPHDTALAEELVRVQNEVRAALLEAVGRVHPDASQLVANNVRGGIIQGFPILALDRVAAYLPRYSRIFVTNYDILSYWAKVRASVADLFQGSDPFSVERAERWFRSNPSPKIFFLHGALHLWRSLSTNQEGKHIAGAATPLLDVVRASVDDPDRVPLFISEGSSAEKVARIRASQYLSFCARALDATDSPLTVLGQSLGDVDEHIAASIQAHPARRVAVGVHVGENLNSGEREDTLLTRANEIQGRLASCRNVVFFDSAEHPLTSARLRCR